MRPDWVTLIGLLAAAFTTVSYFPQVMKTLRTRHTKDISLLMYVILAAGLFLWFIYGLILNDLPIIAANGVTFILALTILVLKIRHG
ncbi:MAG: SemiSWEET transporter [Nitrospirae bacterium]|nr:SemiSWEET transporter [Nitrospirota bacterium]